MIDVVDPEVGVVAVVVAVAVVVESIRPLRASARSTVATTASTARSRLRCRAFCGWDRRHGIFLREQVLGLGGGRERMEGAVYQSSPPDNGDVAWKGPNMTALVGLQRGGPSLMERQLELFELVCSIA